MKQNLARDLRPLYITRSIEQVSQYIKTLPSHEMQQRNTFKNIFILFYFIPIYLSLGDESARCEFKVKFLSLQTVKSARLF